MDPLNMQTILPKFPQTHYGKLNVIQKEENELLTNQMITNDEVERNNNKIIKTKQTSEINKLRDKETKENLNQNIKKKKKLRMKNFDLEI